MKHLLTLLLAFTLFACSDQDPAQDSTDNTSPASETSSSETSLETNPATAQGFDKSDPDWKVKVTAPEPMEFAADKTYEWHLETNKGTMTFNLYHEAAPMHVTSTIYLTELGFYDDVIFHRVIPGFMAQGGDPTGTGRGGPAYRYDGEFAAGLSHTKPGLLSMANAGPGTDGSQFFITFVPTPFLDGKHTIFGELISGMDVLKTLESKGSRSGQTSEALIINKASIVVK
ncbi:MAG: peptidylprolyl isomerase [Pseudomonadales bacterium]